MTRTDQFYSQYFTLIKFIVLPDPYLILEVTFR